MDHPTHPMLQALLWYVHEAENAAERLEEFSEEDFGAVREAIAHAHDLVELAFRVYAPCADGDAADFIDDLRRRGL